MSVILKLAETATTCDDCSFTFVEPSAEVTGESHAWNTVTKTMNLVIEGTGLCPASEPQAALTIDGQDQMLLSCSESRAEFILEFTDFTAYDFDILFGDGYPKGYNIIQALSM